MDTVDAGEGVADASGDRFTGAFDVIRAAAGPAAETIGGGELFDEAVDFLLGLRSGLAVPDVLRVVDVLFQLGDPTLVGRPRGVVDDRLGGVGVDGQTIVESLPDRWRRPRRGGGPGKVQDVEFVPRRGEESGQVPQALAVTEGDDQPAGARQPATSTPVTGAYVVV
jgi:hypothetical protein